MAVPDLPVHRYDLNREQVDLLKRTIAKGASDDELALFLAVAKRHRLDPFTRQLHLIPRWDKNLPNPDGGKGGFVRTIQVGIDGYRQMASRYPDFGSVSEAEYGPMGKDPTNKVMVPEWARVKVKKRGMTEPSVGVAYWSEYAPPLDILEAFMWRKMPRHMLAKCAEALALRKAHPDLADVYTTEEMSRTNLEATPSGRQTADPEEDNAYLQRYKEREREAMDKLTPTQRAILEEKILKSVQLGTNGAEPRKAELQADSLRYTYFPESETYHIDGPHDLKHENRDLLGPLWNGKNIVATPADLGRLISQFENRKVAFKELKRA